MIHLSESVFCYLKKVNWLALDKISSILISLVTFSIITHYIEPQTYGLILFCMYFFGLFKPIINLYPPILLNKKISQNLESSFIVSQVIKLRLFSIITFSPIIMLLFFLFKEDNIPTHYSLITITCLLVSFFSFTETYYLAHSKFKEKSVISILSVLLYSLLKILVVIHYPNIYFLLLVFSIEKTIPYIMLLFKEPKLLNALHKSYTVSFKTLIPLIKESWALTASATLTILFSSIDIILIGYLLNTLEVGIYGTANRITSIFLIIPFLFITPILPTLLGKNKEKSKQGFIKSYQVLMVLSILIILPFTFLSPVLLPYVIGSQYLESIQICQLLVLSLPFIYWGVLTRYQLVYANQMKILLIFTTLSLIFNIAINLYLIPLLGLYGPALTSILTNIFFSILLPSFSNITRDITKYQVSALLTINKLSIHPTDK